jgi:hypothetical protein
MNKVEFGTQMPTPVSPKKAEVDVFSLESIFPDADAVFTFQFKTLAQIKDSGCFVLDANTLLLPYAAGSKALSEIKTTYKALIGQKRLLIPARAAREFAKNRTKKIAELHSALIDQQSRQQSTSRDNYPLLEDSKEYQALIEAGAKVQSAIKEYRELFGDVIKAVEAWEWNDPIGQLYHELFTPDLVVNTTKPPNELRTEHAYRFANQIPPGYKDSGKLDEGIGDYLIWQTILEIGKTQKKSVIFVTGEKKPDWWHNSSKRQLYPRYELVDEFRRASAGESFHIITFSDLLTMFGVSETAVNEIRREESAVSQGMQADGAVAIWLQNRGYSLLSVAASSGFDFIAEGEAGRLWVQVKCIAGSKIDTLLGNLTSALLSSRPEEKLLVLVCSSRDTGILALRHLSDVGGFRWTIGFIGSDGHFAPMWGPNPPL